MKYLAAALVLLFSASAGAGTVKAPDAARQKALLHLLRQDCGACHGMTMNGGLGNALHAEALRGKDDATLVATILHGRAGTAMPPWKAFLSEEEAAWLVQQLRATPAPRTP